MLLDFIETKNFKKLKELKRGEVDRIIGLLLKEYTFFKREGIYKYNKELLLIAATEEEIKKGGRTSLLVIASLIYLEGGDSFSETRFKETIKSLCQKAKGKK